MTRQSFRVTVIGVICTLASVIACQKPAEGTYGRELAREAMRQHTDVRSVTLLTADQDGAKMRATSDKDGERAATPTELASARAGQSASAQGDHVVVVQPLLNVNGEPIGTMQVTLAGADIAKESATAAAIQNEVGARLNDADNVFERYPYGKISDNNVAQALLLKTMERHPEAVVLAIHAVPPGETDGVIVACNVGRVGMASDEADLAVIKTGRSEMKARPASSRYKVQVPLIAANGETVGAFSVFYKYHEGEDASTFEARAKAIRDELRAEIPDKAALFKPSPVHS